MLGMQGTADRRSGHQRLVEKSAGGEAQGERLNADVVERHPRRKLWRSSLGCRRQYEVVERDRVSVP
jgi:hypothetical protein